MSNLVGFNMVTKITVITAVVVPGATTGAYVTARAEGTAAGTLGIYQNNNTAAGSLVGRLRIAAGGADELGVPVRVYDGCRVLMSTTAMTGYIYVR